MKLSEIRAKFPQYNDLSNDELLIGLHRKFYSDIPLNKFVSRIEYDTERADPTEGMSGGAKFLAGAGKAFADIGRGVGQMVGLVDRKDVAESRKLDAPLMSTGAGLAGNIVGNVGALAPTAFIPGAATLPGAAIIGAASGFVQPSTSTSETLFNTGIGGIAAPATIAAGRALSAGYQGGKALLQPFTRTGQERLAADILQRSATDPQKAAQLAQNARMLVPGSAPTLAQVADDPGLAQLERAIRNNPEFAGALQTRDAAQRAARLKAVSDVGGTDDYYNAIKEGVKVFAKEDYRKAINEGVDLKMADAMRPQIDNLLERPSIQKARTVAINLAKEESQNIDDFGSVQGLDWLKKALDNEISKAGQPGSSIGKEELRALVRTKDDLMKTLEQIAPNYKVANDNYAKMMRQVNSMDVARNLYGKLQKPGSEYAGNSAREMADAYQRALSESVESVKKATGQNKALSDVMNTRDIAALESVARDLGRKQFAENAGRAVGSPTMQNMASQNMLRRVLGPTGLPESWAESTMLQSLLSPVQGAANLTGANQRVMERLANAVIDPRDAAMLLTMPVAGPPRGLLSAPVQRAIPGVTSGLLGVQFSQ